MYCWVNIPTSLVNGLRKHSPSMPMILRGRKEGAGGGAEASPGLHSRLCAHNNLLTEVVIVLICVHKQPIATLLCGHVTFCKINCYNESINVSTKCETAHATAE